MPRVPSGEKCDSSFFESTPENNQQICFLGQICRAPMSGVDSICVPMVKRGDFCGKDGSEECSTIDECTEGADGKFRCSPFSRGILGSPCRRLDFNLRCVDALDLICRKSTCVKKSAVGGQCIDESCCMSDICSTSKVCAPQQPVGG